MKVDRQKLSGAYFTPEHIAQALVCWAVKAPADRLLDPSCGDGRFLVPHRNAVGIEQDAVSAHEAIDRAPAALVHEGDFFQWAEATAERFECCAGNPPFIRYQHFSGQTRQRALSLCARLGAPFSGLTSSWAPFLVAAASLLKAGGRMAFVVPAEIGHAPYAAPLLEYLVSHFSTVHVIAVREKLFPQLSEDCWLLYADGFGGSSSAIRFTAMDRFRWSAMPPSDFQLVTLSEWRIWNRRLRPFVLPPRVRDLYLEFANSDSCERLAAFADIGIGYVSGANDFFHLRPSEAAALGIGPRFLHPTVRNGRVLPEKQITQSTVKAWLDADEKALLLRITPAQELPAAVKRYLESEMGRVARGAYKCRKRSPWYAVPDVQIPDLVLSYMSGRFPQLVRNGAGVTCTNSVHSVRIRDRTLAARLLPSWDSALVQLSCELEGHPLGGGMLKLEVREASQILFHAPDLVTDRAAARDFRDGVEMMQSWRHYTA